jgi:hypothetical protein
MGIAELEMQISSINAEIGRYTYDIENVIKPLINRMKTHKTNFEDAYKECQTSIDNDIYLHENKIWKAHRKASMYLNEFEINKTTVEEYIRVLEEGTISAEYTLETAGHHINNLNNEINSINNEIARIRDEEARAEAERLRLVASLSNKPRGR